MIFEFYFSTIKPNITYVDFLVQQKKKTYVDFENSIYTFFFGKIQYMLFPKEL